VVPPSDHLTPASLKSPSRTSTSPRSSMMKSSTRFVRDSSSPAPGVPTACAYSSLVIYRHRLRHDRARGYGRQREVELEGAVKVAVANEAKAKGPGAGADEAMINNDVSKGEFVVEVVGKGEVADEISDGVVDPSLYGTQCATHICHARVAAQLQPLGRTGLAPDAARDCVGGKRNNGRRSAGGHLVRGGCEDVTQAGFHVQSRLDLRREHFMTGLGQDVRSCHFWNAPPVWALKR
jgi:hypothetical protein